MKLDILYIIVSVLLGALGQILLKRGMASFGSLTLSLDNLGVLLWRMATNPYVFLGLAVYVLSTIIWLIALSRVELSYAYPFAGLGYVVMLIASWILFAENITPLRILGSLTIIIGVWLISRS